MTTSHIMIKDENGKIVWETYRDMYGIINEEPPKWTENKKYTFYIEMIL